MKVFWILIVATFKAIVGVPDGAKSDPSYADYSYTCPQVYVFESSDSLVNFVSQNGIKTGYKVFSGGEYSVSFTPKIQTK